MKYRTLFSVITGAVGMVTAAAILILCTVCHDQKPILLKPSEAARNCANSFMTAVCREEFDTASCVLLGMPDLGVDRKPVDDVGVLIWDAYWESTEFTLQGECYATETGLAQDISFTCLDIDAITGKLRERSLMKLEQRVQAAEDTSEIYTEDNEYREDVVMSVLFDAAEEILEENHPRITVELTINLCCEDGQWWIVPDKELLDTIFCGRIL